MSETTFDQLQQLHETDGPKAAIDCLIASLESNKQFHRLFDAMLLKQKFEMGLPLARPTSFDDVPDDKRNDFEKAYIAAARRVGELLLADDKLPDAWVYFRTIQEPGPVREALEAIKPRQLGDEQTEQMVNVALYEGAHPVKGLEIMLHTHGTCNTITALDQSMPQLSPEDRQRAAAMLVRNVYGDLKQTLQHEVSQKLAMVPPADSIRELIAGRDWLFEEGNYHIDVSHLNSVVRFARSLEPGNDALPLAIELSEYGSRLADQFQYPGDPPFDEFYPAHLQFFKALSGEGVDEAVAYFQKKLDDEPDEQDKQLIAYVMVDLLSRIGRWDKALEVAEPHLKQVEQAEFSFARLCQQAGRMDALERAARENEDLVSYTAALVQGAAGAVSA